MGLLSDGINGFICSWVFVPHHIAQLRLHWWLKRLLGGDRRDPNNPFQCDKVVLNLPQPGFDPSKAWVVKLRADGHVAFDLFTFVDDECITGPTEPLTWNSGHQVGSMQSRTTCLGWSSHPCCAKIVCLCPHLWGKMAQSAENSREILNLINEGV